jgi:signal transduction histidine kinase
MELKLQDFLSKNREMLIARCRSRVAARRAPRAAEQELWYGIPLFLDQLISALRLEQDSGAWDAGTAPFGPPTIKEASSSSDIATTAAQHGSELFLRGFTVGQVVYDYGDLCQAITDVAIEQNAAISTAEFRTLNRCLDNAIADAVTEFGHQREELATDEYTRSTNERLGILAHELRNLIHRAILAVAAMKEGSVGLGGATGALLDRSLTGLHDLVDRTLVDVRLTAGLSERRERIVVADLIAEVQVAATIEAVGRDLELVVAPIDLALAVEGDRQILAASVANVLQNAVKFTRPHSRVSLTAYTAADRILIGVEDECGGLPGGKTEEIFRPFTQLSADRAGLGLGLAISRRGVEANGGKLHVRDLPGTGCVFTIDLPRAAPLSAGRGRLHPEPEEARRRPRLV